MIDARQKSQHQQIQLKGRDKRSSGSLPPPAPPAALNKAPSTPEHTPLDAEEPSMAELLKGDNTLSAVVRHVYSYTSFELSMTSTKLKNIPHPPAHCLFKTHNYTISIFPRPQDNSPVLLPELYRYVATATLKSTSNHIQPLGYSFQHNYTKDSLELVVSFHAASFARNTEFHLLIDVYLDEMDGGNKLTRLLSLESDPFYVYSKPDVYVKQMRGSSSTKKKKKSTPVTPASSSPTSSVNASPVRVHSSLSNPVDILAKAALSAQDPQTPLSERRSKKRSNPATDPTNTATTTRTNSSSAGSNVDTPPLLPEPSSQDSLPSSLVATPPHKKRKLNQHATETAMASSMEDTAGRALSALSAYASRMSPGSPPPTFSMSPPRTGESSPPPGRFFSSQESTFNMDDRNSQRMDIALFQDSMPKTMKPLKKRFSQDA